ncbi:MAG: ABC transporter substrate-binding protein [Deltaproteobacteria bacterium CG_4_10_14_3_um_filter_51_14]|nr:MAG: ABC transporter substrate-binding protein [Deltaproteobacteria bacterium CG_4_10_14_3_um_filter_51_14]
MERREFLKKAGIGAAAVAATAVGAPAVIAQKKYNWKMVTTWPPKLPVLQDGAERFAKRVAELTNGRIKIQVFAGGELVPPLGVFDAVSAGTVECGTGAAYYWAGKNPATQWFSAVPFGLNAQGMAAWFHGANGLKLWEETYAPFNLVPRPGGSTGVQMGGWFNKKINSLDDYKGLKMRIPGLGGKVVAGAGGTVVLTAGGEIFTNLERGVIDATEWVGPMHDLRMGFYQAAKYYYYPGWHEPGTYLEFMFNKKVYDGLPKDLQAIIDMACVENEMWTLSQFESQNGAALQTLITKHNVELIKFPDDVMAGLKKLSVDIVEAEAAKDPMAKKVHEDFKAFQKVIGTWGAISERAYYNDIVEKYALKA